MLTVKQVATRLNVSPQIIYELVTAGKLSCHRIGVGRGTIRISEEDLEAYLATTRSKLPLSSSNQPPRPLRHIDMPNPNHS